MKILPADIRALYPFANNRDHYFSVGRHYLHFVDEGQGEAVVLLHGNPTWSFFYRDLIRALSGEFRAIAPDHLGCGLSDKPQKASYNLKAHIEHVHQLLTHLKIKRFHLVVHDWGGAIGMGLALRRPEQVGKIVLLNTAAFFRPELPRSIAACRLPVVGEFLVRRLNLFALGAAYMAARKPLKGPVKRGFLYPYSSYADRVALYHFVKDIPRDPQHPSWSTLQAIQHGLPFLKKETLICWGMQDFCFHEAFLNHWKSLWPHARSLVFPQAGHYLLEDAGPEVVPAIVKFLKSTK